MTRGGPQMPSCCKYLLGQRRALVRGKGPCICHQTRSRLLPGLCAEGSPAASGSRASLWVCSAMLGGYPRAGAQAPESDWLRLSAGLSSRAVCGTKAECGSAGRGRPVRPACWHLSSPSSALPPAPPALGPHSLLTLPLASPSIPHTAAADFSQIGPCLPCTNPGSDFPWC